MFPPSEYSSDAMSTGKKIFSSIPWILPLGATVFIAAMSIPPDQANSNLSQWMHKIGISEVPAWLSNPRADHLGIRYTFMFLIAYFVTWKITAWLKRRRSEPLEIIFDPKNPGRQFWSLETMKTDSGHITGIECRVKVRNRTDKTIHEVKATTERIGPMGAMPTRLIFHQTREATFSLDPGASAFVNLFFAPLPIIQPGMLTGTSTAAYGPIRVTASATDTRAVEKIFQFSPLSIRFDPFEEPMIIQAR